MIILVCANTFEMSRFTKFCDCKKVLRDVAVFITCLDWFVISYENKEGRNILFGQLC